MVKRTRIALYVLGGIVIIAVAQWISIQMAESYERPVEEAMMACPDVEVRAINIFTGAIHTFADPCGVPPGWVEL